MFVRKKKYPSGNIGIIVAEKVRGKVRELVTIGVAKDQDDTGPLIDEAREWIDREQARRQPRLDLFGEQRDACEREREEVERVVSRVINVLLNGADLILDRVGFNRIDDEVFRKLVKARLSCPASKKAHVCICFVALKVYKELERLLSGTDIKLSVDRVLALAKTVVTIQIQMPENKSVFTKTMLMKRHQPIARLFDLNFWVTR